MVEKNGCYVDKTGFIRLLEEYQNPVFLRPRRFNAQCNTSILSVVRRYRKCFEDTNVIDKDEDASINLKTLLTLIKDYDLPKLYVIIDEYDNFANQLITSHQDSLYRVLTADNSFLKNFFKVLKDGSGDDAITSIFITGVRPITIDDLSSGYGITMLPGNVST